MATLKSNNTPFAVHYKKVRIHLCETATNSTKIHSLAQKKRIFAPKSDSLTNFAFYSTFINIFGHSFASFDIQKKKI